MQRSVVLNIVGLTDRLIGEYTPNISSFCQERSKYSVKPVFPALTCTAQSTYLTGKDVKDHGIVANGWYSRDLAEHQFWKQSNHLVKGPKVWDILREENSAFTCAKVFWWYNMYSTADYSITPRPIYPSDGSKVFDVYTNPMSMRDEIKMTWAHSLSKIFGGPCLVLSLQNGLRNPPNGLKKSTRQHCHWSICLIWITVCKRTVQMQQFKF